MNARRHRAARGGGWFGEEGGLRSHHEGDRRSRLRRALGRLLPTVCLMAFLHLWRRWTYRSRPHRQAVGHELVPLRARPSSSRVSRGSGRWDSRPPKIPFGRTLDRLDASRGHHTIPPTAVDAIKSEGTNGFHDPSHRGGRQRDVVRVAPHEAHEPHVGDDGHGVPHQEGAPATGSGGPVQHRAAREVSTALDERHARQDLYRFGPGPDGVVGTLDPFQVRLRNVDGGRSPAPGSTPPSFRRNAGGRWPGRRSHRAARSIRPPPGRRSRRSPTGSCQQGSARAAPAARSRTTAQPPPR
jgi:hypothetical protein